MNFAVPVDHRVKFKECEQRDNYLDLARELKKLWNMNVMIIPIVIGDLSKVTKRSVQGQAYLKLTECVEMVQTTALRSARIL